MLKTSLGVNIKKSAQSWENYTSDPYITDLVNYGLRLDLIENPNKNVYNADPLSKAETSVINAEVIKILDKKVVQPSLFQEGEFVSGVFTRNKKDGSKRMILNLKKFNENVYYKHFKMETIKNIQPNVYMASIDLKDAFYSVPIRVSDQKYLKFKANEFYQYTCMPNGYGPAMRIFTKLTKIPFPFLRKKGHSLLFM